MFCPGRRQDHGSRSEGSETERSGPLCLVETAVADGFGENVDRKHLDCDGGPTVASRPRLAGRTTGPGRHRDTLNRGVPAQTIIAGSIRSLAPSRLRSLKLRFLPNPTRQRGNIDIDIDSLTRRVIKILVRQPKPQLQNLRSGLDAVAAGEGSSFL